MSSKSLRTTLAVGVAAVSVTLATGVAFAQDRADAWTLGPPYGHGGAHYFIAPGMYLGASPGPPIFVPGRGIVNEPCALPTSACPNSDRPAD
jgi:hypothetical protein